MYLTNYSDLILVALPLYEANGQTFEIWCHIFLKNFSKFLQCVPYDNLNEKGRKKLTVNVQNYVD